MTDEDLLTRVERLERDNRRLKRLGIAALALATVLGTIYATRPAPQKLTAHELDIVDSRGNVRIKLATLSNVPAVALYDAQGNPRAIMYVHTDGSPQIAAYDAQGKPRAIMYVHTGGSPQIAVYDAQDKARAVMAVPDGAPGIRLFDAKGNDRAGMAVLDGSPGIGLFDAKGNDRAVMVVSADGSPDIDLSDPGGYKMDLGSTKTVTATTGQTQRTSAASIVMFGNDKKHHVIWQAP